MTDRDHSGVFVRAQCDKCGAFANVELPVNIAAAWKAAGDARRAKPCEHKHVITTKDGAKCRDCQTALRFEQRLGLYVEAAV